MKKTARELARRRGQGITKVLTDLLRREVERERRKRKPNDLETRMRRIDEIVKRYNSRPLRDDRSDDEIIGYNDQGHFDRW
jgi:antitoxin VapB